MDNSTTEKLSRLFELHKTGRITLEEYNLLKKRLLQESQVFTFENISDSVNEDTEDNNIIKNEKNEEADEFDETTDETLQIDESIAEKSRTPKSKNVLIVIISIIIIASVFYMFYCFQIILRKQAQKFKILSQIQIHKKLLVAHLNTAN